MRERTLAVLVGILVAALPALTAQANSLSLFSSEIVGIEVDGQVVAGIPGGAPWVVEEGDAKISRFGTLKVDVEGLLLLDGTVGPVRDVFASVHCASGGTGEEAFSEVTRSDAVPLSEEGDFKVFNFVELPEQCSAAIVLVRIKTLDAGFVGGTPGETVDVEEDLGIVAPWIAGSGF